MMQVRRETFYDQTGVKRVLLRDRGVEMKLMHLLRDEIEWRRITAWGKEPQERHSVIGRQDMSDNH